MNEHVKKLWQLLCCLLPIRVRGWELCVARCGDEAAYPTSKLTGSCDAVLWTTEFRQDGAGNWTVYDVMEQGVTLIPEEHRNHPHLDEYLLGWALAVQEVLSHDLELLPMPSDLVAADVLKLKTPETADDFKKALLAKKRLGKVVRNYCACSGDLEVCQAVQRCQEEYKRQQQERQLEDGEVECEVVE